jgi:hypothetical protein
MEVINSDEVLRRILGSCPSGYEERLRVNLTFRGVGRMSLFFYLVTGGRRYPLKARELGRVMGLNIRVVDDLLDGDLVEPVESRAEFLYNYIECFHRGIEPDTVDLSEEEVAYQSGRILHDFMDDFPGVRDEMKATMVEAAGKLEDEDKTTKEGYRRYVDAAGGDLGELCVEILRVLPRYELEDRHRSFARDLSMAATVADDIADNDLNIGEEFLRTELEGHYSELRSYDSIMVKLATRVKPEFIKKAVEFHERLNYNFAT